MTESTPQEHENDLFESLELVPDEVKTICETYIEQLEQGEQCGYQLCKDFLAALKPHGYEFEYGLDAEPFDLRRSDLD